MYIGAVSVMGTMNMGVLPAWRLLLRPLPPAAAALGLPLGLPGMGWKSEKIALFSGWQGLFAVEEATLWFCVGVGLVHASVKLFWSWQEG
jgi:hypothetical protein